MTPEEPDTAASDAGRADEARPAPSDLPAEPETPSERMVAYLLDAPAELEDWAATKLSEIDPDGTIAARAAAAERSPAPAAAVPVGRRTGTRTSSFPWKSILIGAVAVLVVLRLYKGQA